MEQPIPVTRSRLPFIAIAVWAAILTAIVAVGVVFGGRGAASGDQSPLGGAGANLTALNAPLTADPSPTPSAGASAAPGTPGDHGGKGPFGFAFGRGDFGPGGPGGPGRDRGPISITAINGSQLSLKTDDGWSRTIDATGATITEQGGATIAIGDLKVGDQVAFRQTRNTDGTYKITDIVRIPPQAAGTVASVDANSATLTLPDGSTKTIGITASTTYTVRGKAATAADLKVGTRVHAIGTTDGNGSFTATRIDIAPAEVGGTVTAKTESTITIKNGAGTSVTINVDASTTYQTRGKENATLADVAVGDVLAAEGTLNSDSSLNATTVRFGQAGPGGFRGPGAFGGFGPGWGRGFGRGGADQPSATASPAPSASAG